MGENSKSSTRARQAAMEVVRTLRNAGHTAYFAGGCVRDELLGRSPEDYDIATDATPDRVVSLFERTHTVGVSFAVVLVLAQPHLYQHFSQHLYQQHHL
jgi:poly(A) polymerase